MKNKLSLLSVCILMLEIIFAQAPKISYQTPQAYTVGKTITPLLAANKGGTVAYGIVSSFAGKNNFQDGFVKVLGFEEPRGIAVDTQGIAYVIDKNKILKISPAGVVTPLAGGSLGSTDGIGASASFNFPHGIAVDTQGTVYVADHGNNKIRKISPKGEVTTLAGSGSEGSDDGIGTSASFYFPKGIAVDTQGTVYVSDTNNNMIRKISPAGVVTTLAGSGSDGSTDGIGTSATFNSPSSITLDTQGNAYVADIFNHKIRKISPTGEVSTLVDNGSCGSSDNFYLPSGVAVDSQGDVYVADTGNNKIRKISPAGVVTTFACNDSGGSLNGADTSLEFRGPCCIVVDANIVYVADLNSIRRINKTGMNSIFVDGGWQGCDKGFGVSASFSSPSGITIDAQGTLYIANYGNNKISRISPAGEITTLAGGDSEGSKDAIGTSASFYKPEGIAVDGQGNIYVADYGNNKIRKITQAGVVTTLAGNGSEGSTDGIGSSVSFKFPSGVAVSAQGNVYVADRGNNKIRKISSAGVVTTLAGSGAVGSADGIGSSANFDKPVDVALDAQDNLYVADHGNNKIRKITKAGVVTTLAGSGSYGCDNGNGPSASFSSPSGVAVDIQGNVYVADSGNEQIRKISQTGAVTTLAGSGLEGYADGIGSLARFSYLVSLVVDAQGSIYVVERYNKKLRRVETKGYTVSPDLPAGLSLDPATGTISGTPTAVSPQTIYTVTATNNSGSSTATINITVN